ncbi:hypothetical protein [Bradyrhizobium brasilense]|uniref:hypothetical protein n=1 Tax=Bradyrhizobium brasilense TaxID=1419277 RepID=UPI001E293D7C|nr:hypothetical protein [Bradyrhizobium brasilense]MCC8972161.1 hypothetical protein [Bradyrhizobium brasilense]
MPVKRRVSKRRSFTLTPEVSAAFEAGDQLALHRALGLKPWQPSPLRDDLEGPAPYGPPELCWNQARPLVAGIRKVILMANRKSRRDLANANPR